MILGPAEQSSPKKRKHAASSTFLERKGVYADGVPHEEWRAPTELAVLEGGESELWYYLAPERVLGRS
jgi:hypothetical protein